MTERERDKLIRSHIGFVYYLARKYLNPHIPYEDIVQAGMIGLIRAIDRFDPTRDLKIITYAQFHIKERIEDYIKRHGTITQSVCISRRRLKLNRAANAFYAKHGREATDEELATITEIRLDKVVELKQLQTMVTNVTDVIELQNIAQQEDDKPVANVDVLFEGLTDREVLILKLRNGFIDDRVYKLREVADIIGVTKTRTQQIESELLGKLRERKKSVLTKLREETI